MQRAKARQSTDRFEAESHAFFERVRKCYLERAAADPSRYVVINAAAPLDQVKAQIQSSVSDL
jgi:dTMP kinase